jgi:hypothetical protein
VTPNATRLWPKVSIQPSGCWHWIGAKDTSGYGRFRVGNRMERAHRAVWRLCVGDIPTGLQLNHDCDVRDCVRPEHVYIGTQGDNVRDA